MQVHKQKFFQGNWGGVGEGARFRELGHLNKHSVKSTRKKTPQGNILEFFLLDTLKTTF